MACMDPRACVFADDDDPPSSATQQQQQQQQNRHHHLHLTTSWADMPADAVEGIMKKIGPTAALPRFASACKSWHLVATSRVRNPRWNRLPWLLLATEDYLGMFHSRSRWRTTVRTFYSPSDMSFHEIHVPLGRRCIGSSDGWLVMHMSCQDEMQALNPVTRHRIPLPAPREGLPGCWRSVYFGFVHKVFLSCSPLASRECVALALHGMESEMAIARPGDEAWTIVTMKKQVERLWPFENAVYYEGKFYAINSHGKIWRVDPATGEATLFVSAPPVEEINYYLYHYQVKSWTHAHYLLESLGSLFYVFRKRIHVGANERGGDLPYYRTSTFYVLEMREQDGAVVWEKVTSLGDRSFFLGFTVSKAVNATEIADCRRNCIYFTDDILYYNGGKGTGHDMGFYSLEDDKVYGYMPYAVDSILDDDNISSPSSLVLPDSGSPWTPPVWFFPSLE